MSCTSRASKPLSPLEQHWEDVLAAEGMPATISDLTQAGHTPNRLVCVRLDPELAEIAQIDSGGPMRVVDTGAAVAWRLFMASIWRLPPTWPEHDRDILLSYAEHANVNRAARECSTTRGMVRGVLRRFEAWRKAHPCR